ncbi:MAG: MoaD family protein [Candidatus Bathyarchaeota archaeon]|nr:MAG: MoaD family protein [Candidatus Bathyarchaeota archaeon]
MTTRIRVQFFAMFREIVGKREILQSMPSQPTLKEVLKKLAEKYGKDFEETINKTTGQVDVNTLVMLNGRNIRETDVKLKDNDLIIITVPAGGG